jgi:hypothetical protein
MGTVDEDLMAEINESLRIMGEADLRWAKLVRKIAKPKSVPQDEKESDQTQSAPTKRESLTAKARGCDLS